MILLSCPYSKVSNLIFAKNLFFKQASIANKVDPNINIIIIPVE